jgi:hypothetical protein
MSSISSFNLPPSLLLCTAEHHAKLAFSLLDGTFDENERFVKSLRQNPSNAPFLFLIFSATSFADALNAWRGGEKVEFAEHTQQSQQQEHKEPKLVPNPLCVGRAEPQPTATLSFVCYNCCKKFVGEAALCCIQVCSKKFCTSACSDAHWSKNKIHCPAPACSRRFFLLKDGIIRNGAAFCCSVCADNIEVQK